MADKHDDHGKHKGQEKHDDPVITTMDIGDSTGEGGDSGDHVPTPPPPPK